MEVGVPLEKVPGGGDGDDDSGADAWAQDGLDCFGQGLGPGLGQLEEELSPSPEERAKQAWDGQDHVSVRYWSQGSQASRR